MSEVVVRGIKNEHGEEVGLMAEIYPSEQVDPDNVVADVKEALKDLPGYKHISKIVIRSEPFAKTTTNKIKR